MNPDTTPTPMTDAIQFQPKPISLSIENEMLRALSRQLERELQEKCLEADTFRRHLKINVELRSKEKKENQKLRALLDELINGSTRMTKQIIDEYNQLTK